MKPTQQTSSTGPEVQSACWMVVVMHGGVCCVCALCLQPYLKYHNPRTFEDMDKPIPNFKKFGLKSGEGGP